VKLGMRNANPKGVKQNRRSRKMLMALTK